MPLTAEQAAILLAADEANLAGKVKSGRTLSLAERARLEQLTSGSTPSQPATAYVTQLSDVARLLGISRQRLNYLRRKPGFPAPDSAGRWKTPDLLAWAKAVGLPPSDSDVPQVAAPVSEEPLDLYQQRARLAKEAADTAALRNAQLRGELVELSAVDAAWDLIRSNVRQRLLSLPPKVESQTNAPPEIRVRLRAILEREIDDLLTDLSTVPTYQTDNTPAPDGPTEEHS